MAGLALALACECLGRRANFVDELERGYMQWWGNEQAGSKKRRR